MEIFSSLKKLDLFTCGGFISLYTFHFHKFHNVHNVQLIIERQKERSRIKNQNDIDYVKARPGPCEMPPTER